MQFIGVGANDTVGEMTRFIDERGVGGFPHIFDGDGNVWVEFGVSYQPAFVFVAADGTRTRFGALGQDDVEAQIAQLFG